MKSIIVEVKGSEFKSNGSIYMKKIIHVPKEKLPEVGSKILIADPDLLHGFKMLHSAFISLIETRDPTIFSILKQHISKEGAAFITGVAENVSE